MSFLLQSARQLAAQAQAQTVQPGDAVIDCTMGNGHDTAYLAGLVGENGRVYAFDIQPEAVASTRGRLESEGLLPRCRLYCQGHETVAETVPEQIRLAVMNLGWLPGGDKSITTHWETTRKAIEGCLSLLLPLGVMTVCAYPGHAEGERELRELVNFFASLRPQEYNVLQQRFVNPGPGAPVCFVIQKQEARGK